MNDKDVVGETETWQRLRMQICRRRKTETIIEKVMEAYNEGAFASSSIANGIIREAITGAIAVDNGTLPLNDLIDILAEYILLFDSSL
jgi:hypothetical protein